MTDRDELTLADEIVARARIHAREVVADDRLPVDLGAVEWAVSSRARRRAGCCRWDADRDVATIVLARRAYERYDWPAFAGIVRHELVHAWEFQRFGESGHGDRFRERAAALEAPRHCEAFAEPRYVLRCRATGCDWQANRHRASKPVKSPDRYRCGDCGGVYEVEHVESGRTWTDASGYGGAKAALGEKW
ncbi:SprT family zinc-dependent metalloprotease [Natrinema salaciae]|uniref:SprT-like family protein n=1 Tax=Natrinema salaciae TaxID=1186196 RepID=A0A1H9Q9G9_9EURY|nr:SprT-like domain-containing protein [Natrinema salaciae]SER56795.1 SprT-like family protein [Natrinema salaciae]